MLFFTRDEGKTVFTKRQTVLCLREKTSIKILSLLVLFVLVLSVSTVSTAFAYTYPSGFWGVNSKYAAAVNNQDYANIIKYGTEELNMVRNTADCVEKQDLMVTRYHQVGLAYAKLGHYESSAEIFQNLYHYAIQYGDTYYDYVKTAKARVTQYASRIALYTDKGKSTYYGAVNEKKNGVLFGLCSNGASRSKTGHESMVLTYQELGQPLLSYNVGILRSAASEGLAVEFALNCPKEGIDIKNIKQMNSYLKEISNLFSRYSDTPIYLRFAAEFDIWSNLSEPEAYKEAFRYVSKYFKDRNKNVAIVWSPNQVSNWHINIDDFYPGDAYVDWVGISLYAQRYFLGDANQKEENEIVFKSGINSDPVLAVKDIVEKYGNRKPIMISEMGCGHKLAESGQDTGDFALRRLQEYLNYLPMVYPQIKLMAYFDWYVVNEKNDFRLSTNTRLQNEFVKTTKTARFIQDGYKNNTDFCYREVVNGTSVESVFPVSCYAHRYNAELMQVTYFIDDNYVGMSNQIPFTANIDASSYPGTHRLKAVAMFSDGQTLVTEQTIMISDTSKKRITVEISGKEVRFDQEPILYNSRTMVPMRKIFEALGATITWDGSTQTVTGKKGDRTVKVTVGSHTMYVNQTKYVLDTAPIIISERTLVPARAVAEGLGCEVEWDGRASLVSITPKVFRWSDWEEDLPSYVTSDLYYIEEVDEYRYRTREKRYFTLKHQFNSSNYVGTETTYGEWSDWQDSYITPSANLEVATRKQSSPKQYHYAHYCTGDESDPELRYQTANYKYSDRCSYHDYGWVSEPLEPATDGSGYIKYKENGKEYRCSNGCYRWYLVETTGGTYTQYRSRKITTEHVYYEWDDWNSWSRWSEEDPYDEYDGPRGSIEVDERTVYRYKEKG